MTLDWIHLALAVVGAVATVLYNKFRAPAPAPAPPPLPKVPTPDAPVPDAPGFPILDAILEILKQLSANKPVTGVDAQVVHGDSKTQITIQRNDTHANP